ncbi:hypothetical protein LP316_13885 [Thalassotalea sp. LPB0316]|uniref:hypothetical protein n=1 Tax=Thalassotalea sp. LPB0316 TaxID=2769490 RepID=UPI001866C44D|nr:hypothetical protein [Thalassotalea sp. LPB0316]QOL25372.1 hypothetical protein LP316_13885 [Thalassotalea sp. LPB0316]
MKSDQHEKMSQVLECEQSDLQYSQAREETADALLNLAPKMNSLDVPNWDRQSLFDKTTTTKGSSGSFLPWLSMTCSVLAVCLVLFNVQFQHSDNGFTIAFGQTDQEAITQVELDAAIAQAIKQYEQDSELKLAQLVMQLNEQQSQSNLKLASYLLDSARKERKEDISDVFLHFTDQMAEQQSRQNIQLKQLQQAVKYQNTSLFDSSL